MSRGSGCVTTARLGRKIARTPKFGLRHKTPTPTRTPRLGQRHKTLTPATTPSFGLCHIRLGLR